MVEEAPQLLATEGVQGAIIQNAYVARQVKVLAILESEVHTIAVFNTLATIFFSLGSALISMAIGIWANGAFAEKLTPEGAVLSHFGAPVLCVIGLIMYGIAYWANSNRKSKLELIRAESKTAN